MLSKAHKTKVPEQSDDCAQLKEKFLFLFRPRPMSIKLHPNEALIDEPKRWTDTDKEGEDEDEICEIVKNSQGIPEIRCSVIPTPRPPF